MRVEPGSADRQGDRKRWQLVADVAGEVPDLFFEIAEGHAGALAIGCKPVDIVTYGFIVAVVERSFIGSVALRLGIAGTEVEIEVAEVELTDQLGIEQLALEPGGSLINLLSRATGNRVTQLNVVTCGKPTGFERVANQQAGPAELMLADQSRKTDQAVRNNAIVGTDHVEVGSDPGVRLGLLLGIAGAPAVAVSGAADQSDLGTGKVERCAPAQVETVVRGDIVVGLKDVGSAVRKAGRDVPQLGARKFGAVDR